MSFINKVIVGDCFKVLPELPPDSVDLCVTSPPYWGLRDYGEASAMFGGDLLCQHEWVTETVASRGNRDAGFNVRWGNSPGEDKQQKKNDMHAVIGTCSLCGAWKGQLGLEPHPQMFIDHLVEFGRLIRRVLKPSGLFWLNLGDTYYSNPSNQKSKQVGPRYQVEQGDEKRQNRTLFKLNWLQPKQLLMIPSRVACALQDDGWILRSDVIWYKPNHMPESVTDRFTKSYEHFFMFSREQKYFFNLDAVREKAQWDMWSTKCDSKKYPNNNPKSNYKGKFIGENVNSETLGSPRARNSRVLKSWGASEDGKYDRESIKNYNGIQEPKEVKKRIIEGFLKNPNRGKNPGDVWVIPTQPFPGSHFAVFPEKLVERIIKCSSPPKGVVLDPFAGSGTTLRVARKLGRHFIGIELNPEYAEMAEQRIRGRDFRIKTEGTLDATLGAQELSESGVCGGSEEPHTAVNLTDAPATQVYALGAYTALHLV